MAKVTAVFQANFLQLPVKALRFTEATKTLKADY